MRRLNLHEALAATVVASAAPYGYTVSLWSSGALLINANGVPRVTDVFGFAGGALAGFVSLGLVARPALERERAHEPDDRLLAGMLNWFAVFTVLGAVALIAQINAWIAWPVASFLATSVYLGGAGAQLAYVAARFDRSREPARRA